MQQRYHEWILAQLRKERAMQLDLFTHAHTQCGYHRCGELVHQDDATIKEYVDNTNEVRREVFCSQICAEIWYITTLRERGL